MSEATYTLLYGNFLSCDICGNVRTLTKENASEICSGISKLPGKIAADLLNYAIMEEIHITCITRVVKIAVEEFLSFIRT